MSWRYITEAEVHRVNYRITGSPDLLVEPMLLRSAVGRQWMGHGDQEFYPTLHEKAGALLHGLTTNHAFIEGNKRTAVVSTAAFCLFNGRPLRASDDELFDLVVDTADRTPPVEEVIDRLGWLLRRSAQRSMDDISQ